MTLSLTRRAALTGAAALPFAAAAATQATAGGHGGKAGLPLARSFSIGSLGVTTLLDASFMREGPKDAFASTATQEEFEQVSTKNFLPVDKAQFYFTPTLVDTGSELVLFDTGLGQGGIAKALADAGVTPDAVDVVVLTHMHPDHIGGLMTDGAPTFPNARYVTGRQEYDGWLAMGQNRVTDLMAKNVTPLAEKMTFVDDGATIAPGITSVATFGHTPGHMGYRLESDGAQLMLVADVVPHYVYSFSRPEWHFGFDVDKDAAATTRRKLLDMLAAEKIPMIGYHMPFPGTGYVETREDGFRFVPVGYQLG